LNKASNSWGVELNGSDEDKRAWRLLLKPPFDPYVEEVNDDRGDYLALRSSVFNGIVASNEIHRVAKNLFTTLNVAMSANFDLDPVTNGAVVEFVPVGRPRRMHHLEANGITMRVRIGMAELAGKDSHGNVIQMPPVPSRVQLWLRATALEPEIGSALRYLYGKPGWTELYKAHEAVKHLPNGGISKREISRFTQTANAAERHHPNSKYMPHKRPMELWEARALITQWVSAAIDHVVANNP
jgi:hypothetical protein